jgi:MFS family permease
MARTSDLGVKHAQADALPRGSLVAIVLLGFSGQLAWAVENQFFNAFLYDKVTPDARPISLMVSLSAVVALLTTILMGTLSDRARNGRWGRRRVFILGGYLAWGIFTAAFPLAAFFKSVTLGIAMAILFDCVMTFWGSTANDSSFNAWVTDITVPSNRGKYLGVLEILKWTALLVTYGGAGFVVSGLGYTWFFAAVGAAVLLMGLVGGFLVREPVPTEKPEIGYWRQIGKTFQWQTLKANHSLLLVLLAVLLWNIAFNIFFPYLLIYLQHFVMLQGIQSSILIALGILAGGILMAYPLGLLSDRWGRKPVALASVAAEFLGLLLFSLTRSFGALLAAGILWIMPMAAWSISTGAWERDLFPEESRGQYQGYEILFRTTLPMMIGPVIGAWLSTRYGIPTVLGGKEGIIPTSIIFQVAAFATLLAAVPLFAARETGKKAVAR